MVDFDTALMRFICRNLRNIGIFALDKRNIQMFKNFALSFDQTRGDVALVECIDRRGGRLINGSVHSAIRGLGYDRYANITYII